MFYGKYLLQPGDLHLQNGKDLSEFIMNLPRDPGSLFLQPRLQVGRKVAQLRMGFLQLLLRQLTLGNVHQGADHPDRLSLLVVNDIAAIEDGGISAVAAKKPVFTRPESLAAVDRGENPRKDPIPVVRVEPVDPPFYGLLDLLRLIIKKRLKVLAPPVGV